MKPPIVDIHTHHSSPGVLAVRSHRLGIGEPVPHAPYSAGIHPWDAGEIVDPENIYAQLDSLPIVMIGEIGLDHAYGSPEEWAQQEEVFVRQAKIAERRNLPVIIHCVRAFEDMMAILSRFNLGVVIFHGYTGSPEQTQRLLSKGYYISVGRRSLASPKTVESIKSIPADRLFLETDDDTMPIMDVYEAVAAIRSVPVDDLIRDVYNNYINIFEK